MSIGVSIFLLVVGAILTFAVHVDSPGFNVNTVGVILMLAGALGLAMSMYFWRNSRRRRLVRSDGVIEERPVEREIPPDLP